MSGPIQHAPAIIEEAAKSPLGIVALIILVIGALGVVFFKKESATVRVGVFALLFVGAVLATSAVLRKVPDALPSPPVSPTDQNSPVIELPPSEQPIDVGTLTKPIVDEKPDTIDDGPPIVDPKPLSIEPVPQEMKIDEAWVTLYDDNNFRDRQLTVKYPKDISDMKDVASDDGERGFGDKASSVRYRIPEGWSVILYQHDSFRGKSYTLVGTGREESNGDLGGLGDDTSSLKWSTR